MCVGALVALDPDRPDDRQHAEGLPELAVEAGGADLLLEDRVGLADDLEALAGDLPADDADREARPRERLAPDETVRQAELRRDSPDLVLEEHPQWLDQLHLHLLGQPADVVMRLDGRGGPPVAARLDHVGVQRALNEEARVLDLAGLLLEDADELLA